MSLLTSYDAIVNAGSGVILLGFGLWILTLEPRKRSTLSLGLFSVSFGVFLVAWNIFTIDDPLWTNGVFLGVTGTLGLVATALLIDLALRVPRKLGPGDGRSLVGATGALVVWGWPVPGLLVGGVSDSVPFALSILVQSVYFLLLTLAALRHGRQADPVDREQLRLLSAALLLYPAAAVGHFLVEGRYPAPLLGVVLVALLAGLWIWNGRGGPPRERRSCRNLALLGPAVALATALFVSLASRTFSDPPGGPHWGLSRMVGVLLLAYAILRHQLLGLDAKVRWGISRSTVAAAFVAVFFVVSEGAQVLFAGFAQSELLGIGAAGLLVFALAPLQRIADRLATRAIPGPSSDATPGRATYRAALRVALADGGVSPREEMELAHLQRELDLDPVEVLRLRQEEEGRGDPGDAGPE